MSIMAELLCVGDFFGSDFVVFEMTVNSPQARFGTFETKMATRHVIPKILWKMGDFEQSIA